MGFLNLGLSVRHRAKLVRLFNAWIFWSSHDVLASLVLLWESILNLLQLIVVLRLNAWVLWSSEGLVSFYLILWR